MTGAIGGTDPASVDWLVVPGFPSTLNLLWPDENVPTWTLQVADAQVAVETAATGSMMTVGLVAEQTTVVVGLGWVLVDAAGVPKVAGQFHRWAGRGGTALQSTRVTVADGPTVTVTLAAAGPPGLPGLPGPPGVGGVSATDVTAAITAARPSAILADPSVIDGDIWRGPNGLITGRLTAGGRAYTDVASVAGAGASVIDNNELVWGRTDGTLPNSTSGASYALVDLGTQPDMIAQTVKFSSSTAQGAAATTDGAGTPVYCSSYASTSGYQCAIRSVHCSIGSKYWSIGIFDFDNVMGLGAGFQKLTYNNGYAASGTCATFPYDTEINVWVIRVADRLVCKLPDGSVVVTDPNPWVPIFWGTKVGFEPFQPATQTTVGATYATDHQIRLCSWVARRNGIPTVLASAALTSVQRSATTGLMSAGQLPADFQSKLTLAAHFPGTAAAYVSTPAVTLGSGVTAFIRYVEPDTWRPAANQAFIAQYGASGQWAFEFFVNSGGALGFVRSTDGTTAAVAASTVAVPSGTIGKLGVAAVHDAATGNVTFYTSTDSGVTWAQLGSVVTTLAAGAIFAGTAPIELGSYLNGLVHRYAGYGYGAEIRTGSLTGTTVTSWNASPTATYTDPQGHVWALHDPGTIGWKLVAFTSSFLTAADAAALAAASSGGGIPTTLADAKGDLLIATADNTVARHGVPANGNLLVPDSTATDGWAERIPFWKRPNRAAAWLCASSYPFASTLAGVGVSAGTRYMPFDQHQARTFDQWGLFVPVLGVLGTGGTAMTAKIGLYASDSDGQVTGNPILSVETAPVVDLTSGGGAASTLHSAAFASSITIPAGRYWISLSIASTTWGTSPTIAQIYYVTLTDPRVASTTIVAPYNSGFYQAAAVTPPSPAAPATAGTFGWAVYLRQTA